MAPQYPREDRSRDGRPRRNDNRRPDNRRSDDRGRGGGRGRPPRSRDRSGPPDIKYGERGGQGSISGPPVDEDAVIAALDPTVRRELSSLPGTLAEKVAGHLIMAARLLDEDPELARKHAVTAHDLAPRIVAVREALAIASYRDGDYRTAIREARTVRRMAGDDSWLPVIADCERGLGRPDRALDVLAESDLSALSEGLRAECLIVQAGARIDLEQQEAAIAVFEDSGLLRTRVRSDRAARFRSAYADALRGMGRDDEADKWERLAAATYPGAGPDGEQRARELAEVDIVDVALDEWLDDEEVSTGEPALGEAVVREAAADDAAADPESPAT